MYLDKKSWFVWRFQNHNKHPNLSDSRGCQHQVWVFLYLPISCLSFFISQVSSPFYMLHPFHWDCARDHLLLYKTGKWSVTPFLPAPQRRNGFVRAASELQRFILKHLWGYIVQREEAQKTHYQESFCTYTASYEPKHQCSWPIY